MFNFVHLLCVNKISRNDQEFVFIFIEWPRSIHEDHNSSNVAVKDAIDEGFRSLYHFVATDESVKPLSHVLPRDGLICDECGIKSENISALAEHYKQEHSSVAFCVPCCKAFKSTRGFDYHQRMHQGGLSCDVCGKIVPSESHLKRHKLTHSAEKSFPCPLCGKLFKHKFHVNGHLKKVHGQHL